MTHFEHTVVIDRPLEDVWSYVIDARNNPVWQTMVTDVGRGADQPLAVGSEFDEVMHFLGRRFDVTWTVTEHEPRRRSAVRCTSGPVEMRGSYPFEPAQGGTRFTMEGETDAHGLFKLAEPVFARIARRDGDTSCAVLKDLLEADVENPPAQEQRYG